MNQAATLDHVGVVGRDLDTLAATFERFGFLLTPLARHAGGRTGNRCVMLRQGYIELLAVLLGGSSATLERFLARHAGAHLLALGIDDPAAVGARLHRAGMPAEVAETDRAVDAADPDGPRARFTLLTPPDRPEGRCHLIHHLTPAALWQERFLHHPNHAVALTEAILLADAPAEVAAFLSRLAGRPVVPDAAEGFALDLPQGRVRVLPALPGVPEAPRPRIAALGIRTDDGNAALLGRLQAGGIAHWIEDGAVCVEAGGVVLRFVG